MSEFDVSALLADGAAGKLQAANTEPSAQAQQPWTDTTLPSPEEVQTAAMTRANHALAIATLLLLVEKGTITETEAAGVVDHARGLAAMDAGYVGPWNAADGVLRDASRALDLIFAEARAREARTVSGARH